LRERALREPDQVALREKDLGVWQEVTWSQYWDVVLDVAQVELHHTRPAGMKMV